MSVSQRRKAASNLHSASAFSLVLVDETAKSDAKGPLSPPRPCDYSRKGYASLPTGWDSRFSRFRNQYIQKPSCRRFHESSILKEFDSSPTSFGNRVPDRYCNSGSSATDARATGVRCQVTDG